MSECNSIELTYYQRNRDMILNRAKYYDENDKERLREQARDKYRNLSEEEKNIKREYGKNRYQNMFNCNLIVYAVNLVIHIIITEIVFDYNLIVCAIYLYIIKPIYLCYFRQTSRDKSPMIYD